MFMSSFVTFKLPNLPDTCIAFFSRTTVIIAVESDSVAKLSVSSMNDTAADQVMPNIQWTHSRRTLSSWTLTRILPLDDSATGVNSLASRLLFARVEPGCNFSETNADMMKSYTAMSGSGDALKMNVDSLTSTTCSKPSNVVMKFGESFCTLAYPTFSKSLSSVTSLSGEDTKSIFSFPGWKRVMDSDLLDMRPSPFSYHMRT